jgi:hypothetical protein
MADITAGNIVQQTSPHVCKVENQDKVGKNWTVLTWKVTGDASGVTAPMDTGLSEIKYVGWSQYSGTSYTGTVRSAWSGDVVTATFSTAPANDAIFYFKIEGYS